MLYMYYFLAIGVPILLAYVYGVVPISLCRGGDCGVKDENDTLASIMFGGQAAASTTDLPGTAAITYSHIIVELLIYYYYYY